MLYKTISEILLSSKYSSKPFVQDNSVCIQEGDVYFLESNNLQFLLDALHRGAKFVLCHKNIFSCIDSDKIVGYNLILKHVSNNKVAKTESSLDSMNSVIFITYEDDSFSLPAFLESYYNLKKPYIFAVTGTDGKGSSVSFVRQLLTMMGEKCLSVEANRAICENIEIENFRQTLTTPSTCNIYKALEIATSLHKVKYAIFEASSHGLHRKRFGLLKCDIACLTNISQDHLDYHKTMENYVECKKSIFTDLLSSTGIAVINADSQFSNEMLNACEERNIKVISLGRAASDLHLLAINNLPNGQEFLCEYKGKTYVIQMHLLGEFQVYNVLCAMGILLAAGFDIEKLIPLIKNLKSLEGRMEHIYVNEKSRQSMNVYVDYGHTTGAMQSVLASAKKHVPTGGKLIVLFGCGGNKDKIKRPIMGEIANHLANIIIITDDNSRNEDRASIRKDIMQGIDKNTSKTVFEIDDRRKAIMFAMSQATSKDIIIIAGRGNETEQNLGDIIIPFKDADIVREWMKQNIK